MFIYVIILCAVVVITYLLQFQSYSHYHDRDLSEDVREFIGLPNGKVFEYELTEEEQLSGLFIKQT